MLLEHPYQVWEVDSQSESRNKKAKQITYTVNLTMKKHTNNHKKTQERPVLTATPFNFILEALEWALWSNTATASCGM